MQVRGILGCTVSPTGHVPGIDRSTSIKLLSLDGTCRAASELHGRTRTCTLGTTGHGHPARQRAQGAKSGTPTCLAAWHGTLPGTAARRHCEQRTSAFPFMPALLSLEVAAS